MTNKAIDHLANAKVGDWLWLKPPDHRRYPDQWELVQVKGFTRISILTGGGWRERKFDKNTGLERTRGWRGSMVMGEYEKCDFLFGDIHRYRISEMVSRLTDVNLLRQVAKLIGYIEKEPTS